MKETKNEVSRKEKSIAMECDYTLTDILFTIIHSVFFFSFIHIELHCIATCFLSALHEWKYDLYDITMSPLNDAMQHNIYFSPTTTTTKCVDNEHWRSFYRRTNQNESNFQQKWNNKKINWRMSSTIRSSFIIVKGKR